MLIGSISIGQIVKLATCMNEQYGTETRMVTILILHSSAPCVTGSYVTDRVTVDNHKVKSPGRITTYKASIVLMRQNLMK